ncbi:MAG TPA: glutathione S-transferase family protein [Rubrobacteraceae bacterium]|nr:glutathione S-transferase family protein [Rubrobacteraceae bacterium]
MALGMLVEGEWTTHGIPKDSDGRFVRAETSFRDWVTADGSSGYKTEPDRYHLYLASACPWAHRAALLRRLKGLEEAISISIVDPFMGNNGWMFSDAPGTIPDTLNSASYLREVYQKADPDYTGRVTTPVLWDKETETIVNNESREIIRMLDTEFEDLATNDVDYGPDDLREEIDRTIDEIYEPINNGVYKSGFATTQAAYEEAVITLFDALDHWEEVLGGRRYLCGDRITEADWCMFPTLVRFDPVYHYHFKCNIRRISDYPNLWGYLKDLYQQPGVAETVNFDHIKQHYYMSHESVNPTRIVPIGPEMNLNEPHGREHISG